MTYQRKLKIVLLCMAAALSSVTARAQQPAAPAAAPAKNSIESVQASQSNGNVVVKVLLKEPLVGSLGSFSVSNPARVAIDFPATANGTQGSVSFNEGDLRSANLVQVADRTRVVLNLLRPLTYTTQVNGREVLITLANLPARSQEPAPAARFAEQQGASTHSVRDISFRRGKDGEGRIVVDLSDPNAGIDIRQQGASLVVDFLKTTVPERLSRRLDVTDFATPVNTVVTSAQGDSVRMVITPKGLWEHNAYQTDNQFVVEVKALKEDPNKLVQGAGNKKFNGEKLSLNFQNIDVRSVLAAIAEFTNFNIVTSDAVSGSLTLRLKDIPWDQALNIILQAKGLDMRKNGNVIWVAPRDELAAREKLELDSQAQIGDIEPLRTESFQINYHSAKAIYDGILKDKEKTILSKRGVVVMDERSNKLIVSDVPARLDDVRRLLSEIDVAVKQVLIESQIVEASDSFARNLGVRLGFMGLLGNTYSGNSKLTVGAGIEGTGYAAGLTTTQATWNTSNVQNVNLAAPSINGKSAGVLSAVLYNSSGTRFVDLELSALEADGRGKVVSRPRVMTADQNEAVIEQGVDVPYQSCSGNSGCSVSYRKAVLSMKVRPQVTPDGRIAMTVDVNKDSVSSSVSTSSGLAIDTKHVSTRVLVDNGGTVVLGGIYQQDIRNNTTKIPWLGDLPVLGYLFRENERSDSKTELMIFITPRILTDQTAAR
ncbi:type IV pilus secretin PilQ [Uliginosibacterium sediminicola]|uniref:type IV pilus secretin PilQ n=1 Tax=Uliginosibacterium sediminicola TaxID=2024550 RepID=UPI0031F6F868